MGVELIVIRQNDDPEGSFGVDQSGHRVLAKYLDQLDELTRSLATKGFFAFFDAAGAEFEMFEEIHGEEPPENWLEENRKWFSPAEAIVCGQQIIEILNQQKPSFVEQDDFEVLVEDLNDCLRLLRTIERKNDLFCFSIII